MRSCPSVGVFQKSVMAAVRVPSKYSRRMSYRCLPRSAMLPVCVARTDVCHESISSFPSTHSRTPSLLRVTNVYVSLVRDLTSPSQRTAKVFPAMREAGLSWSGQSKATDLSIRDDVAPVKLRLLK